MRRSRHKLQVSTFPFLAVLLGAMGSLIFLLLVMDRRAKIVARNKAREAQEARLAAVTASDCRRQEEWEEQRRRLHDLLATQDQQLRGQLHEVHSELHQRTHELDAQITAQRELAARIDAESAALTQQRDELRLRQASLSQTAKLEESAKSELTRLTRSLLDMEQALAGLKRLKENQQPTYSLVPFRGQRGENRMPIYVECSHGGLIFLPDRLTLAAGDLDIAVFRAEVERRHGPLVKARRLDPFAPNPEAELPYVLFLIRPDGIRSYYHGQNALRGYQIDYGYELVDAGWTLEAPAPGGPRFAAFPSSPERSVVTLPQQTSKGGFAVPGVSAIAAGSGSGGPLGAGGAYGPPNATGGGTTPGGGLANDGSGTPRGAAIARGSAAGGNISGSASPGGNPGGLAQTPGIPSLSSDGGNSFGQQVTGRSSVAGNPGSAPGVPTVPGTLSFRPTQAGGASSILDGPAPGIRIPGAIAKGDNGSASDGASVKPQAANGDTSAKLASNGDPSAKQQADAASAKMPGAPGGSASNQQTGAASAGVQSSASGPTQQPQSDDGAPQTGNSIDRLAGPRVTPTKEKKSRTATPPVSFRVVGNRDFVITLACYEKGVLLTPGGATFAWNSQTDAKQTDDALVRAVAELVNRRQATVREGEPPYRAVLRFEVREPGRRTYYRVYPLLERLHLPMVREDVEE
jgi:hypothetical protein